MLSRLVHRPANLNLLNKVIPSLPSYRKVLNHGQIRFASSSSLEYFEKIENDANADAIKLRNEGPVGQFGWIPFYGMVGVIAISKELVVCGTEFMLAFAFGSWVFISYVGFGEMISKSVTEGLADRKDMFDKISDYHIEKLRVHKAKTQVGIETVPILEEMLKQQRSVEKAYLAAQNFEQRHALQKAFLAKLNQIKVLEDAEAALERSLLIDKAVENVYNAFVTDKGPLGVEALETAISLLGTDGSTRLENDPVKKLFLKELQ